MINVQLTAEQRAFLIALLSERVYDNNEFAAEAESCGEVKEAAGYKKEARTCAELIAVIEASAITK